MAFRTGAIAMGSIAMPAATIKLRVPRRSSSPTAFDHIQVCQSPTAVCQAWQSLHTASAGFNQPTPPFAKLFWEPSVCWRVRTPGRYRRQPSHRLSLSTCPGAPSSPGPPVAQSVNETESCRGRKDISELDRQTSRSGRGVSGSTWCSGGGQKYYFLLLAP